MMSMQRKVIIVAAILLAIALIIVGIGFWRVVVEYIVPRDPGDRKDVIQTFALVVAGLVGAIGGAVSIANLQTSRRTLQHQRELENQRAQEQRLVEGQRAQDDALQSY